jgi:chromosomal replication initiation ATPase DnaA
MTMRSIAEAVASEHGRTLADLRGGSPKHRDAHPRQRAYAAIRGTGRYSLTQIGRFFNRHHTTVLYGLRSLSKRCGGAE